MTAIIFLIALLASFAGGISGIGGGVIIRPALELFQQIEIDTVNFLSGCTVLSMTSVFLLGTVRGTRQFDLRRGSYLAAGSAAGGLIGKLGFNLVCSGLADRRVSLVQSAILIAILIALILYLVRQNRIQTHSIQRAVLIVLTGLAMGALSSFLGIGGGPFNLAVLSFLFSMDSKQAASCSLYIIFFSQLSNLVYSLFTGTVPAFSWPFLISSILGGVFGGIIGKQVGKRCSSQNIRWLYGGILLLVLGITSRNFVASLFF